MLGRGIQAIELLRSFETTVMNSIIYGKNYSYLLLVDKSSSVGNTTGLKAVLDFPRVIKNMLKLPLGQMALKHHP